MAETRRFRITIGHITYEVEGQHDFVEKELRWFKDHILEEIDWQVGPTPPGPTPPDRKPEQKPVFVEWFKRAPGSAQDAVAFVAYYLETWEGKETINAQDVSTWFRRGNRSPPSNPNATINNAMTRRGYFDKAAGTGEYQLNETGRYFVESHLSSEA